MRNARLDEAQAGIKIAGRNINNLRYTDDTALMAESEEERNMLLKKMKEESENVGLKLNSQKTKIMASGPITSWQIDGETMETVTDFTFLGSKITEDGDCSHEIKRCLLLGRKAMTNLDSILKKQRHYWASKGLSSQRYGFSSSHVWMWELDYKESPALKNWCFWTVVLEKTPDSPLDCKEIKPVNHKGNQSWIFIGRTDIKAEPPTLGQHDTKNWPIWKYPDAGKDWWQEKKGTIENEMVGWHHWLDGHEFEQPAGVSDRTGGLACCSPRGSKESDIDWTELKIPTLVITRMDCSWSHDSLC